MIEPLEQRIAPASLIDARTIAFTDVDGDDVKVVFSKDVFIGAAPAQLAKANEVFKFDTGDVASDIATPQQLRLIDFTKFPVVASKGSTVNGIGVTITAIQKPGGDGFVDVGAIKAVGVSLGKVTIAGDLGQIDAGGSGLKIGVAGLTVQSLGKRGTGTQIPVPNPTVENPAPDLVSTITGQLSFLKVLGDVEHSRIRVVDGKNAQGQVTTAAKLGSLTIDGSLIGRAATETASDDTGLIECDREIGAIVIGRTAAQGIIGGGGSNSGRITAGGKIGNITIAGGIIGGAGANSGSIAGSNHVGVVKIGGDLAGGAGDGSGVLRTFGDISGLTIGDDITAGAGPGSGVIIALGTIKKALVNGDLDGTIENAGTGSAGIFSNGLKNLIITGSLLGGSGAGTAFVESGRDIGVLSVGGSLVGGAGTSSASIVAQGAAKSLTVKGNLIGGDGRQSAVLISGFDPLQPGGMGTVAVLGRIEGDGESSGAVLAGGDVKVLTIGSKASPAADVLKGGEGSFSGTISARGKIASVRLIGNVVGGAGAGSGSLLAFDRMDVNGEFAGDLGSGSITGTLAGGGGANSGTIMLDGALSSLTVGSIEGGSGNGSGVVRTGGGLFASGNAGAIRVLGTFKQSVVAPGAGSASLLIGGKLGTLSVASTTSGATIRVGENISSLMFGGDVIDSTISAFGQAVQGAKTDIAIGKLGIRGSSIGSSFLAGYDFGGNAANPDAQIGAVTVKLDWTASNLVAGAAEGSDAGFGNASDVKAPGVDNSAIVSRIASILIGGTVTGEAGGNFGFVAQLIAKSKFGTTVFALNSAADTQSFDVGGAGSGVTIREVALT